MRKVMRAAQRVFDRDARKAARLRRLLEGGVQRPADVEAAEDEVRHHVVKRRRGNPPTRPAGEAGWRLDPPLREEGDPRLRKKASSGLAGAEAREDRTLRSHEAYGRDRRAAPFGDEGRPFENRRRDGGVRDAPFEEYHQPPAGADLLDQRPRGQRTGGIGEPRAGEFEQAFDPPALSDVAVKRDESRLVEGAKG